MKRLLLLLAFPVTVFAADIDVVRSQFIGYYTSGGASRATGRMQEALGALESVTREVTAPGFLFADGSWSDIDYADTPDGEWSPWAHTQRLFVMAKAYRTPGQPYYNDARLRGQIDSALAYTRSFYGANEYPAGNWWFWTMGIPLDLGPTLVLMRGDVDPQVYSDLVVAIQLRIGNSPTAKGLVGPTPTGQNLVWSAYTHLCLALLKDDTTMLTAVANAMSSVARPTSGEGIKLDRSFHQHGAQLYTGGYGGSFASDVARYALLTRGTAYSLSPDALASFADYVADGIAWSLHGDYFDVSVISRDVARPTTTGYQGLSALLQASQFPSARQSEIKAAASKMLETWRGTMPNELAGLAAQVEWSSAAWPSGHRHYFASDYTIHRRPGWFASVKMFSARTKSGERTNGENLLGSRQSDGRFHLALRGDEYFGRNVWPAFDWTRMPGTTVEQKADAADDTYGYGRNTLAGGTGDGRNGVSAMELVPLNSSLTAKKAYFFFDDTIVFLTNSITSPSPNRVETIVNQIPTASAVTRGADWAHVDNVGYWSPSMRVERSTRTGTWAALGASSDTTPHTHSFVTMSIDHGATPMNATAEYAIVPNITAAAMREWIASKPITILANNDTVSAVRDLRSGATAIVFWRAGSIDGIQSDAPLLVYVDGTNVYAADPNAGTSGAIRLTIGRSTISIPRNSGQTAHATYVPRPTKRRAVR